MNCLSINTTTFYTKVDYRNKEKQKYNYTNNKKLKFGKALNPNQAEELGNILQQAFELCGIKHSCMVIHSVSFPPIMQNGKVYDLGIGSSSNNKIRQFFKFIKNIFNFRSIQLGPENELINKSFSPYSGASFGMSRRYISPELLLEEKLITPENYKLLESEYQKTKENILSADYQKAEYTASRLFDQSYERFKTMSENSRIKQEFQEYIKDPKTEYWLHLNALYHGAFKTENNSSFLLSWNELDRKLNIYLSDKSNPKYEEALARKTEMEKKYSKQIEKYKFEQFLLHKQKQLAKKISDEEGITLVGDLKIGNGHCDLWSHPRAFIADLDKKTYSTYGYGKNDWGGISINPKTEEGIEFIKKKTEFVLQYNHGIRIDAIYSYINPTLFEHFLFNKTISKEQRFPDVLLKKISQTITENNINWDFVFGENLRNNPLEANISSPSIQQSRIQEIHYLNPQMRQHFINNISHGKKENYYDFIENALRETPSKDLLELYDKMWFAISNHDTGTIANLENNIPLMKRLMKYNLFGSNNTKKDSGWKVQLSFADVFGIKQRHNVPNYNPKDSIVKTLWRSRLPENYEELYYKNLAEKNLGYNMPEILANVMKEKKLNKTHKDLYKKLVNYGKLLRKKEHPMRNFNTLDWTLIAIYSILTLEVVWIGLKYLFSFHKKSTVNQANN